MIDELAIIAVRGLGLGAIYSLVAMSMNVVIGSTHILNFAQGNFFVLGGFIAFMVFSAEFGLPLWFLMIIGAGIIIAILMTAQGWITLAPLKHSVNQHSWLVTTMAVSIIISAVMLLAQGPWVSTVQSPIPPFMVLGVRTPAPYAIAVIMAVMWYVALRWFFNNTLTGLAISAISQDLEAAAAAGLKVKRLQLISFTISGLVVGTAGFAMAPIISIAADTGVRYVLNGFIAAVIGGMGSNLGALVGGPLVGIIAMIATYSIGGQFQTFVSMIVLVLVLMVKPEGLFGRATARRV
jgi:branched-chain amino acid transport system permease protein